ncbi:hypothetical protein BDK51DRAFT_48458 [Blyttiomyces helicus]|uniref:Uncharacterized protein n=1 Tax=Blyttiomyces helicus TaxID=388810 RepID=A0A4P9WF68_9FUNG|nr:hypothetical protein BDK51DRAFT_48458 [Blyttiomyces helicus]|eukprot:RKO91371.1 hypothetical protein BDK51DRAFT_48458 [Blyttiomyces helicus]
MAVGTVVRESVVEEHVLDGVRRHLAVFDRKGFPAHQVSGPGENERGRDAALRHQVYDPKGRIMGVDGVDGPNLGDGGTVGYLVGFRDRVKARPRVGAGVAAGGTKKVFRGPLRIQISPLHRHPNQRRNPLNHHHAPMHDDQPRRDNTSLNIHHDDIREADPNIARNNRHNILPIRVKSDLHRMNKPIDERNSRALELPPDAVPKRDVSEHRGAVDRGGGISAGAETRIAGARGGRGGGQGRSAARDRRAFGLAFGEGEDEGCEKGEGGEEGEEVGSWGGDGVLLRGYGELERRGVFLGRGGAEDEVGEGRERAAEEAGDNVVELERRMRENEGEWRGRKGRILRAT